MRALGSRLIAVVALVFLMAHLTLDGSAYASTPAGLAPSAHIGWQANKTTGGNVCAVASYDECQVSKQSGGAGGFDYPAAAAIDPKTGNVYVAEVNNARVQQITAQGAFVSMFGWDVNETNDRRAGATQEEKNVCTAASKDVCKAGVAGKGAGQLDSPGSVAVDPLTQDVYVLEIESGDVRVDKYTREGRFLWRVGKGVNLTTKGNLCRAREIEAGVRCGAGALNSSESLERGAFKFAQEPGDLLAAGGPEDLLYVGDEHRVQVFAPDGSWRREILLSSISAKPASSVVALALQASGALYLVYRVGNGETELPSEQADVVHRFNPSGEQVAEYLVGGGSPGASESINAMAVGQSGQFAVMGVKLGGSSPGRFGLLYGAGMGAGWTRFVSPADNDGIAFSGDGELYVTTAIDQEVAVYDPWAFGKEPLPCEVVVADSTEALDCHSSGRLAVQ